MDLERQLQWSCHDYTKNSNEILHIVAQLRQPIHETVQAAFERRLIYLPKQQSQLTWQMFELASHLRSHHISASGIAEVEHHRPGLPVVVQGDLAATQTTINEHLVELINSLADFIELLRSERAPAIPGLDASRIHRVWPLIIGIDTPPLLPPLWEVLGQQAMPRLNGTGAEPLTILDATDFETVCGIVEGGRPLPSILERKCAPAFSQLDFSSWLGSDPLCPAPRRPSVLEARYEQVMAEIIAKLPPRSG